jgi:hypothetical protein
MLLALDHPAVNGHHRPIACIGHRLDKSVRHSDYSDRAGSPAREKSDRVVIGFHPARQPGNY